MTMRRTRHKLEPQCDQSCMQGTVQQTRTTLTTKKRHYEDTQVQGTHESSVVVLVSVHMLQVCGHIKHVVELVALHSCHHVTCCQLFPHIHFSPVCEFLSYFVDCHTVENGSFEVLSLHKFRPGLHRCLSLVYPLVVVCFRMSASPSSQGFSFLLAWLTAWHQFSCAPG